MRIKRLFQVLILTAVYAAPLWAQEEDAAQRDAVLREARYLKSIYKTDEAIDRLSTLVKEETMDEEVFAELADCHLQNGAYEDASGIFFMLSSRFPDNLLYKVRQLQLSYREKDYLSSIATGKDIIARDTIPAIAGLIGDAFNQMELQDSALYYYGISLSRQPRNEGIVSKVAKIHLDRKDYDAAIAAADSYLAIDPDNMTVAPVKGLALYLKSDYDPAIEVFEKQLELGNDSYGNHFYLGQSYWHQDVTYRARKELLAAWQIDSSDVNLAYAIAAVNHESMLPFEKEVQPWLDKAIEMVQPDPAFMSRVHQQYALGYYMKQDKMKEAVEHYKEAYRYNPELVSALSTIGYCYEQMKDYKSAREWYEKCLRQAKPGSKSYQFAEHALNYIKGELFMEEGK